MLLALPALLACTSGLAQTYAFDMLSAPYQPLTAPTPCTFDANGFHALTELNGEVFTLFERSYTAGSPYDMVIGDWGFLRADDLTSAVIIDGLFTQLEAVDANSTVSYSISGSSGAHTLTAQWTNWRVASGPDGNYMNFQISLDQATGVVSIHIGPNAPGGMVFNDVNGPNCGIFRANSTFTTCHGKVWIEGDPSEPFIDVATNFDFDALHGFPAAGTLYRLTPSTTAGVTPVDRGRLGAFAANGSLFVDLPEGVSGTSLHLYDASGHEVLRAPATGTRTTIATTGLARGIYVLRAVGTSLAPVRVPIS